MTHLTSGSVWSGHLLHQYHFCHSHQVERTNSVTDKLNTVTAKLSDYGATKCLTLLLYWLPSSPILLLRWTLILPTEQGSSAEDLIV